MENLKKRKREFVYTPTTEAKETTALQSSRGLLTNHEIDYHSSSRARKIGQLFCSRGLISYKQREKFLRSKGKPWRLDGLTNLDADELINYLAVGGDELC